MEITLLSISFLINLVLMVSSHPMAILGLILMQTMSLCLLMWMNMKISWLSYILFLIFMGGLMVIFVYMTSMASNEKFNLFVKEIMTMIIILMSAITLMNWNNLFQQNHEWKINLLGKQNMMIFSEAITPITLMIMTYLLLTLIVSVVISTKNKGPLRNLFMK